MRTLVATQEEEPWDEAAVVAAYRQSYRRNFLQAYCELQASHGRPLALLEAPLQQVSGLLRAHQAQL